MSDLQSPIDRIVSRNINTGNDQAAVEQAQANQLSTQALVEAMAGIKPTKQTEDKFDWAQPTQVTPSNANIDYSDLEQKGVSAETLALIKDLESSPTPKPKSPSVSKEWEEIEDTKQPVARSVIPKLDPNAIVSAVDTSKIFDSKAFAEEITTVLTANPLTVKLDEEIINQLKESNQEWLPSLVQTYSSQAALRSAELAINKVLSLLPEVLTQFSESLNTQVSSSGFQAEVDAYFTNDLEKLIAKEYAPRFVEKNPGATAAQTAKAIQEYIKAQSKPKTKTKEPQVSNELGVGNPYFDLGLQR